MLKAKLFHRMLSQRQRRCFVGAWRVSASGPASFPWMSSRVGYRQAVMFCFLFNGFVAFFGAFRSPFQQLFKSLVNIFDIAWLLKKDTNSGERHSRQRSVDRSQYCQVQTTQQQCNDETIQGTKNYFQTSMLMIFFFTFSDSKGQQHCTGD